jgi:hypothetical protein
VVERYLPAQTSRLNEPEEKEGEGKGKGDSPAMKPSLGKMVLTGDRLEEVVRHRAMGDTTAAVLLSEGGGDNRGPGRRRS